MPNNVDLSNQLLIAMPSMLDPNFQKTVTYICQHDEQGAIGLTLTRATDISLSELLQQLKIEIDHDRMADRIVRAGGPVDPQNGFLLHRPVGDWDATLGITPEIGLTTSIDILKAMAAGNGPEDCIPALGYAGWGGGQLENELAGNAWLTLPAEADMLFNTPPEQLWHEAARALGVDLSLLSGDAGHA